ncbi:acyltransferase family protein [uncultured Fibrobacter sp.]|uniref:acyltransferase n=1 Tax=uncultured Fibrobacter sp. TaxID=261512 RepID=UPI0025E9E2E8|nr:acyltransferase family protein [uncultured Fibrobacter sp.]MBR3669695.1 acyltransferase family protein [Fibrobacter sp.]
MDNQPVMTENTPSADTQKGTLQSPQGHREKYAEWLRIIAAFTVVFQHTVTSAWYDTPVSTPDFFVLTFLNSLTRFGVGVFIMISGAFMLSPKYEQPPRKILSQKLPRIIILIITWGLLYGFINVVCQSGDWLDYLSTPFTLFTQPATHLWFLYTLAGLYLITPALRVFTKNASPRMVLYVIALFFAFGLVLPTANHLLYKLAHISIYKNIGIQGSTTFAGFYLSGFYIAHYGLGNKARKILYSLAAISWFISFFYSTYFSIARDAPNEYFFGNFRPMTFLIAAAIFCYFRTKYSTSTTADSRLIDMSKCMLGVYLIHPIFIKSFYGLHLSILIPHPIVTAPLMTVVFFGLSLYTVRLFRKIPGIRKIL